MKFTVITATFNSEKTLQRTIDSILNQTVKDFEFVVVDGDSSDETVDIIRRNIKKFSEANINFKWISEKDTGIYNAWNKGLKLASGNWVSFLGSDDWYLENAIETYQKGILGEVQNYDLVYSNVNLVNKDKILRQIKGEWRWKIFKKYMNIAHVGAFHNMLYFKKFGDYNEDYKIAGDYELLLRAGIDLKALKIDFVSAHMTDGGISNNNVNLAFRETFNAKHRTAKISYLACLFDYTIAWFKVNAKKLSNAYIR